MLAPVGEEKAPLLRKVLETWLGLGYNNRAVRLKRCAESAPGGLPTDFGGLCALPGIGDYTARAVLSMAYNRPYAVLDGNVARVMARTQAIRGNLHQPGFRRQIEADLAELISRRRPGDFNQALMELGQTVCLPQGPQCGICPIRRYCRARTEGNPENYPQPRPRRAQEIRHLAAAIVRRSSASRPASLTQVALVRGLDEAVLSDLWNFPSRFGNSRRDARRKLELFLVEMAQGTLSWGNRGRPVGRVRHTITYRTIVADLYSVGIEEGLRGNGFRWLPLAELPAAAVSDLARKIAAKVGTFTGG